MTSSSIDWKAICDELVDEWDAASGDPDLLSFADAIDRVRTLLAQPEPEWSTDEEAWELFDSMRFPTFDKLTPGQPEQITGYTPVSPGDFARAVLTRWGRSSIQPMPVAEFLEPEWERQKDQTCRTTDGAQLIDGEWWAPCGDLFSMQRILDNARAHATRYARPAIQPVSEELTDEKWEALKDRLFDRHRTVGYQGELFVYDSGFDAALDDVRRELTHYALPLPIPASSDYH